MTNADACLRCGSTDLEPGVVIGHTFQIAFRPDNAKRWSLKKDEMNVSARMCAECGTMDVVGDIKTLKSIPRKES